jgi:hypothetical protein
MCALLVSPMNWVSYQEASLCLCSWAHASRPSQWVYSVLAYATSGALCYHCKTYAIERPLRFLRLRLAGLTHLRVLKQYGVFFAALRHQLALRRSRNLH